MRMFLLSVDSESEVKVKNEKYELSLLDHCLNE